MQPIECLIEHSIVLIQQCSPSRPGVITTCAVGPDVCITRISIEGFTTFVLFHLTFLSEFVIHHRRVIS